MLRTKAIFERKTNDFQPRDCVIEKIIELASQEYDAFSRNMLADYGFIKDNVDLMYVDQEGTYHCLLVVGEGRPNGVLIESEGGGYARYAAFLPNARDFLSARREQVQGLHDAKPEPETPGMKLSL